MTLSHEQQNVINDIINSRNVLTTGNAGSGKSFLIKAIQGEMTVSTTAFTGVAAINIGGITLHAWSGLPIKQFGSYPKAATVANNISQYKPKIKEKIENCNRLIIDEVSMLDSMTLDLLNDVFKIIRGDKSRAFGGVQLLFFGDFLQLPPIPDKDKYGNKVPTFFAFNADAWKEASVKTNILTKVFRQSDERFVQLLNNIRTGYINQDDLEILRECIGKNRPTDKKPIVLFPTNAQADNLNKEELNKLDTEYKSYQAKDYVCSDLHPDIQVTLRKELNKGIVPEYLELKVGARVMMLRNYLQEYGIANGSLGYVSRFNEEGEPVIEFDNGYTSSIEKQKWEYKENDHVLASRSQYPLRLAFASTIHKSQGLTLDHVECDLTKCFAESQVYVALSRVKSLDGLYLKGFDPSKIKANPYAVQFYQNLQYMLQK